MNAPQSPGELAQQTVELEVGRPALVGPVLERLVSAAAARADLPIDRLVNALTVTDALVHASAATLDGRPRTLTVTYTTGQISIGLNELSKDEAERVIEAATLPAIGDVLRELATSVEVVRDGSGDALRVSLT